MNETVPLVKKVPVVSNPPSDSDSQGSGEDEDGILSHEISNVTGFGKPASYAQR